MGYARPRGRHIAIVLTNVHAFGIEFQSQSNVIVHQKRHTVLAAQSQTITGKLLILNRLPCQTARAFFTPLKQANAVF